MDQLRVIELNNSGVAAMEKGEHKAAVPYLANALKESKRILSRATSSNQIPQERKFGNSTWCQEGEKYSLDYLMTYNSTPISIGYGDDEESRTTIQHDANFLYRQPIPIKTLDTLPNDDFQSSIMLSTVVIFNLALAYHLAALSPNEVSASEMLTKAAKLYEYGFELQRSQQTVSCDLFMLATVNNLGLVRLSLGELERGRSYFQKLLSTLIFLIDTRQIDHLSSIEFFVRNATFVIFSGGAAAAAA